MLPERTADLRGKRALLQFGSTSIIPTDARNSNIVNGVVSEVVAQDESLVLCPNLTYNTLTMLLLRQDVKTSHERLVSP